MSWLRKMLRGGPIAVALVAALFLVACSDEDGDATPTEAAAATEAPAATETAAATEAATEAPTAAPTEEADTSPLKIGYLADFTGPLAEFGPVIQTGVELAIAHINAAGGVHGADVELAVGDTGLDATQGVEEARRLIDIEGVHAIVGPLSSTVTLAVAESVSGDAGIVTISPSATSPGVTAANDNGYLFRSTVSDAAQGVVLAQLATDEGLDNVGVMFLNDAYGQGLAEAFENAFEGTVTTASFEDGQTSYLAELQAAKEGGADFLVAIGFPEQALVFLRESIENDVFTQFLFVDGTKSERLIEGLGADALNGFKGTAPAAGPESDATSAWDAAYTEEYGELPTRPFVREAYDATIAIALAAEAAGTNGGADFLEALVSVTGPSGEAAIPGAEGIAAALDLLRGGDDTDYQGAATSLDWDDNGDVTSGFIGIWEYRDGAIVELESIPFTLE